MITTPAQRFDGSTAAALLLATGIALAGYFVGAGLGDRAPQDGAISVKGLSEREVAATIAVWTLTYAVSGNDLAEVDAKLSQSTASVRKFLVDAGFAEDEIAVQPPWVTDLMLVSRSKDEVPPAARFTGSQSVLLRTAKVDAVKPAIGRAAKLMADGVQLTERVAPTFLFDKLNALKPAMIEEATRNAKVAAEKFAQDSSVRLGKLRKANQGWFKVDDRDAATPERKLVRVIVDVDYEVK
jgi:hypothetical protein